jgi:hypothetical protein
VTPKEVGTLEILGVRWKLSGTIVGFHNFELSHPKKNIVKGRRKAKQSPNEKFKFMVIKVCSSLLFFFIFLSLLPLMFLEKYFEVLFNCVKITTVQALI